LVGEAYFALEWNDGSGADSGPSRGDPKTEIQLGDAAIGAGQGDIAA
jgi:hypothetical protein